MTFLELCQSLRRECGISGTGPTTVVDQTGEYRRVVEWINLAWLEIQQARPDWRFNWAQWSGNLIAATADYTQAALSIEADQYDFGSFVLTDGVGAKRPLRYLPYAAWKDAFNAATLTANVPTYVTDLPNEGLRFTVPPDDAYALTFDYYRKPETLAANTDVPRLPARYHRLIVYKAMMYYAGYEDAPDVLQDAMLRWNPLFDALETTQLPRIGFGHTPLGDE